MTESELLLNIQAQPQSLAHVHSYHSGPGQEALGQAAKLLTAGKHVVLTGMGASLCALIQLEYSLSSHRINACLVEAAELLHYRYQLCDDAVVLVVSCSGESIEIIKLLKLVQGNAKIIGVSNDPESLLARESDVFIHIGSLPDEMVAIQSYTGTVLAMHMLANAVAGKTQDNNEELQPLLNALSSLIEHEVKTISKWDDLLKPDFPPYLLGRGPSYGSVLEGALLFHEASKMPAVGMHAASFRHGPVEIVDRRFVGVIFAADGIARDLNLALARDISRFGGRVLVIGPEDEESKGLQLCSTPRVAEQLAPLLEIVPIQCAVLRLAQLSGLEIGSLRYTPRVTRDEFSFTS